jgi:hypothetical protein
MVGSALFALPLNFSQNTLIVVSYIISLVAITIVGFAVSYAERFNLYRFDHISVIMQHDVVLYFSAMLSKIPCKAFG